MNLWEEIEKILKTYEECGGLEHNVPGCAARLLVVVYKHRGHRRPYIKNPHPDRIGYNHIYSGPCIDCGEPLPVGSRQPVKKEK